MPSFQIPSMDYDVFHLAQYSYYQNGRYQLTIGTFHECGQLMTVATLLDRVNARVSKKTLETVKKSLKSLTNDRVTAQHRKHIHPLDVITLINELSGSKGE